MKGFSRQLRLILASALALGLVACGGSVVTNVSVGGTIAGYSSSALKLSNGYSAVVIPAGATSFVFPTRVSVGLSYNVSVLEQPPGMTCLVTNGAGIAISTDITNVAVTCATNNNLGGTVTGLTSSGLTLANGSSTLNITANGSFVFANKVMDGSTYGVTVLNQPKPQTCSVLNGAGKMTPVDVTSVIVTCN